MKYNSKPEEIEIIEIYNKWGSLHTRRNHRDKDFDKFLGSVQEKSIKTCEICGVHTEINYGDQSEPFTIICTRCENCKDK